MRAHHFLQENMTAGRGNEPAWTVGETRTIQGKLKLCERGYHSSPNWLSALGYAPGPIACVVEVSTPIDKDTTKQVSHTRTLVSARDASQALRLFTCDCAERALQREREDGREPDARSWAAIEVSRLYIAGEATIGELRSAVDASAHAANAANAADAAYAAAYVAYAAANAVAHAAYATNAAAEKKWQRTALATRLNALLEEENNNG